MVDQFTVEEQRAIARTVSELVQPLELKIMVLGRVALFYRYGLGGSSKDVDVHPYPLVNDELTKALASRGGHLEWMACSTPDPPKRGRMRVRPSRTGILRVWTEKRSPAEVLTHYCSIV